MKSRRERAASKMTLLIERLTDAAKVATRESKRHPGLKGRRLIALAEMLAATARSLPKEID